MTLPFSPALILFIFLAPILASCAAEDRELAACWLRPSCLPSEMASVKEAKAQDPPNKERSSSQSSESSQGSMQEPLQPSRPALAKAPTPSPPTPAAIPQASPPSQMPLDCQTSAQAAISAARPSIEISYTEPTTSSDGLPLTNLAQTTVYYDLGAGFIKAKDVPATNPKGGGRIDETITIPVISSQPVEATICITATNTDGLDSVALTKLAPAAPPVASPTPLKDKTAITPIPAESLDCQTLAVTTVSADHPSILLSYTEPTTDVDGSPLTNLAKTSVYYNLGTGFIKAKDVPATTPHGGGDVKETIEIPVTSGHPVDATICITATNTDGLESKSQL